MNIENNKNITFKDFKNARLRDVYNRLCQKADDAKLNQTDFAVYAGVGKWFMQGLRISIKADAQPNTVTFRNLQKICAEHQIDMRWLFTGLFPDEKISFIAPKDQLVKAQEKTNSAEKQSESPPPTQPELTEEACVAFLKAKGNYRIIKIVEQEL